MTHSASVFCRCTTRYYFAVFSSYSRPVSTTSQYSDHQRVGCPNQLPNILEFLFLFRQLRVSDSSKLTFSKRPRDILPLPCRLCSPNWLANSCHSPVSVDWSTILAFSTCFLWNYLPLESSWMPRLATSTWDWTTNGISLYSMLSHLWHLSQLMLGYWLLPSWVCPSWLICRISSLIFGLFVVVSSGHTTSKSLTPVSLSVP